MKKNKRTAITQRFINLLPVCMLLFVVSCAHLPDQENRPVSHAYTDTADTTFAKNFNEMSGSKEGQSVFFLLENGLDAFLARAYLAEYAERSIDAQYYLLHNDLTGRLFIYQLLKAADRGVRVRLLVDDMALGGWDLAASMMDRHPNMELRVFNPFGRNISRTLQFVTRLGSVTRRAHNKSFTVDNLITILGGRNIGNEYFEADPEFSFSDLDVMGFGPVAAEVSDYFDLFWNSDLSYPASRLIPAQSTEEQMEKTRQELNDFVGAQSNSVYMNSLANAELVKIIKNKDGTYYWADSEVLYDQPEKITTSFHDNEEHLATLLSPIMDETTHELIILSPYFVPGKEGTKKLVQLAKKGVRIKILTNSLGSTDVSAVHSGYAKYRKALLRAGIELYELNEQLSDEPKEGKLGSSNSSLHAKVFVFDRKKVFIGSLNLDARAVVHNTEIGVVIDSPEMAQFLSDGFADNINQHAFRLELKWHNNGYQQILWHSIENGKPVIYKKEPHTGYWKRMGVRLMSLLPVESQL